MPDGTDHQWQPAFYLLGLSFSFLFQAPLTVMALSLFALTAVSLLVKAIGHHGSDTFENYFLWDPLAITLGCMVGGFLSIVIAAPPFITSKSFARTPERFWRVVAIALVLLGAILTWGLVTPLPWHWLLPVVMVCVIVIISYALFRYDTLWNVPVRASLAVHGYWLLFLLSSMLAFGLFEEFYTQRHGLEAARYMRAMVAAVGTLHLAVLGTMNIYLPSVVKIDFRYVEEEHADLLETISGASERSHLGGGNGSGSDGDGDDDGNEADVDLRRTDDPVAEALAAAVPSASAAVESTGIYI